MNQGLWRAVLIGKCHADDYDDGDDYNDDGGDDSYDYVDHNGELVCEPDRRIVEVGMMMILSGSTSTKGNLATAGSSRPLQISL